MCAMILRTSLVQYERKPIHCDKSPAHYEMMSNSTSIFCLMCILVCVHCNVVACYDSAYSGQNTQNRNQYL